MTALVILLALMIVGALIALEASDLLSAIVSVGAVGFLLAIAFLLLGAPDLAITQVVVEVVSLIILIRATISRSLTTVSGGRDLPGLVAIVAMVVFVAVSGALVFRALPFGEAVMDRLPGSPSSFYLAQGLEQTGAPNAVTAIILDFRGYDTLGEATVLFGAILGAVTLLRRVARKRPGEADPEGGRRE